MGFWGTPRPGHSHHGNRPTSPKHKQLVSDPCKAASSAAWKGGGERTRVSHLHRNLGIRHLPPKQGDPHFARHPHFMGCPAQRSPSLCIPKTVSPPWLPPLPATMSCLRFRVPHGTALGMGLPPTLHHSHCASRPELSHSRLRPSISWGQPPPAMRLPGE